MNGAALVVNVPAAAVKVKATFMTCLFHLIPTVPPYMKPRPVFKKIPDTLALGLSKLLNKRTKLRSFRQRCL